jgi:hypothetical protein
MFMKILERLFNKFVGAILVLLALLLIVLLL